VGPYPIPTCILFPSPPRIPVCPLNSLAGFRGPPFPEENIDIILKQIFLKGGHVVQLTSFLLIYIDVYDVSQ